MRQKMIDGMPVVTRQCNGCGKATEHLRVDFNRITIMACLTCNRKDFF